MIEGYLHADDSARTVADTHAASWLEEAWQQTRYEAVLQGGGVPSFADRYTTLLRMPVIGFELPFFTQLLSRLCRAQRWVEFASTLHCMHLVGIRPDLTTFQILLEASVQLKRLDDAEALVQV